MSRLWSGLLCCLVVAALIELRHTPAVAQDGPSFVWLVRHAEKGKGDDPILTPAGEKRAKALAKCLEGTGVSAIITSDKRRTKLTAKDSVANFTITPKEVPFDESQPKQHIDAVVKEVRATPGKVLVVGHSNTVPGIIAGLGAPAVGELDVFYRFFTLDRTGPQVAFKAENYGAVPKGTKKKC